MVFVNLDKAGRTVVENLTGRKYCLFQIIRLDLIHAIRKKRLHFISDLENVILHHSNAPLHTAERIRLEIGVLEFQRPEYVPYSRDQVPLVFIFLPMLKTELYDNRSDDQIEIKYTILNFNRLLGDH